MAPSRTRHPDHAAEQAYIERVHQAVEATRSRAERAPELMGDKHAARTARRQLLDRFSGQIDSEAACFGRIDLDSGRTRYVGREAVYAEDGPLLVINWRTPAAAPF